MINFKSLDHGYVFSKDEVEIAVGEYYNGSFLLYEENEENIFPNAMTAFSFLNKKHNPWFYLKPIIKNVPVDDGSVTKITRYKGHVALQTIDKEAFHAWESKHGSRRN